MHSSNISEASTQISDVSRLEIGEHREQLTYPLHQAAFEDCNPYNLSYSQFTQLKNNVLESIITSLLLNTNIFLKKLQFQDKVEASIVQALKKCRQILKRLRNLFEETFDKIDGEQSLCKYRTFFSNFRNLMIANETKFKLLLNMQGIKLEKMIKYWGDCIKMVQDQLQKQLKSVQNQQNTQIYATETQCWNEYKTCV